MILVTGSTGLVGAHLLYHLTKQGGTIKALYRTETKIETVKHVFSYYEKHVESLFRNIQWIKGDITDIPSLEEAFKDVTHVYHCAALVSFDPNDYRKLRQVNIKGTANIVNLCITNEVTKLCYVSSIAAIGKAFKKEDITELTEWNPDIDHSVYAITKYGAEMEVWRGTQEGVNAVIINPGIIIGPGYWNTSSGALFKRIYKGQKYYTTGISGYVDIKDVVFPMIELMKSNISNERYILVSENVSFKDFAITVAKNIDVKPPHKEASKFILNMAWRLDWLSYFFYRKRRKITKQMVISLTTNSSYNNNKILNALSGFKFESVETSIKKTAQLFLKDI